MKDPGIPADNDSLGLGLDFHGDSSSNCFPFNAMRRLVILPQRLLAVECLGVGNAVVHWPSVVMLGKLGNILKMEDKRHRIDMRLRSGHTTSR
jgi:hypothetical protein